MQSSFSQSFVPCYLCSQSTNKTFVRHSLHQCEMFYTTVVSSSRASKINKSSVLKSVRIFDILAKFISNFVSPEGLLHSRASTNDVWQRGVSYGTEHINRDGQKHRLNSSIKTSVSGVHYVCSMWEQIGHPCLISLKKIYEFSCCHCVVESHTLYTMSICFNLIIFIHNSI